MQPTDRLVAARAPALARLLPPADHERYQEHAARLVERVSWEPAQGLDVGPGAVTETVADMAATVAAHAALLVAGFAPATQPYRDVTSVVLHRGTFVDTTPRPGPVQGVVTSSARHLPGRHTTAAGRWCSTGGPSSATSPGHISV